jgi:hypothetical protein
MIETDTAKGKAALGLGERGRGRGRMWSLKGPRLVTTNGEGVPSTLSKEVKERFP